MPALRRCCLPDVDCPNLRDLGLTIFSFSPPHHRYALARFLKRHAPQLTALTLHNGSVKDLLDWAGADLHALCFPRLAEFCISNGQFAARDLPLLNLHMPSVRSLVLVGQFVSSGPAPNISLKLGSWLCYRYGALSVHSDVLGEQFLRNTSVQYLCLRSGQSDLSALGPHVTALDLIGHVATDLSALRRLTNLRSLSMSHLYLPCGVDFTSLPHSLRRLCIGVHRWTSDAHELLRQLAEHCAAMGVTEVELSWQSGEGVRATLDAFVRRVARDGVVQRLGLSGQTVCEAMRGKYAWLAVHRLGDRVWQQRLEVPIT